MKSAVIEDWPVDAVYYSMRVMCLRCRRHRSVTKHTWPSVAGLPHSSPVWQSLWVTDALMHRIHGCQKSRGTRPIHPNNAHGLCPICQETHGFDWGCGEFDCTRSMGASFFNIHYLRCQRCVSRNRQFCVKALCETTQCSGVLEKLFYMRLVAPQLGLVDELCDYVASLLAALVQRRCCDTKLY